MKSEFEWEAIINWPSSGVPSTVDVDNKGGKKHLAENLVSESTESLYKSEAESYGMDIHLTELLDGDNPNIAPSASLGQKSLANNTDLILPPRRAKKIAVERLSAIKYPRSLRSTPYRVNRRSRTPCRWKQGLESEAEKGCGGDRRHVL